MDPSTKPSGVTNMSVRSYRPPTRRNFDVLDWLDLRSRDHHNVALHADELCKAG